MENEDFQFKMTAADGIGEDEILGNANGSTRWEDHRISTKWTWRTVRMR